MCQVYIKSYDIIHYKEPVNIIKCTNYDYLFPRHFKIIILLQINKILKFNTFNLFIYIYVFIHV